MAPLKVGKVILFNVVVIRIQYYKFVIIQWRKLNVITQLSATWYQKLMDIDSFEAKVFFDELWGTSSNLTLLGSGRKSSIFLSSSNCLPYCIKLYRHESFLLSSRSCFDTHIFIMLMLSSSVASNLNSKDPIFSSVSLSVKLRRKRLFSKSSTFERYKQISSSEPRGSSAALIIGVNSRSIIIFSKTDDLGFPSNCRKSIHSTITGISDGPDCNRCKLSVNSLTAERL